MISQFFFERYIDQLIVDITDRLECSLADPLFYIHLCWCFYKFHMIKSQLPINCTSFIRADGVIAAILELFSL